MRLRWYHADRYEAAARMRSKGLTVEDLVEASGLSRSIVEHALAGRSINEHTAQRLGVVLALMGEFEELTWRELFDCLPPWAATEE